ncbi:hypothetical protein BKI52_37670 [marine bacterium AO1-C]|nr:hypothetical protein BKI52_37670 [marine bacterium AO1-C]
MLVFYKKTFSKNKTVTMKKLYLIVILVLAVVTSLYAYQRFYKIKSMPIASQSVPKPNIDSIDRWLQAQQRAGKFNGAVLIAKNHKPLLMKGYGYTDYSRKQKITPQSSFRLASVSKNFTAAAIMLLKEKGLIDYDKSLTTYFTDFPYPNVTVRHLLNHTSGIPDLYMHLANKHSDQVGEILSTKEVVQLMTKFPNKRKSKTPLKRFRYSNTGYVLLAGIVEQVTGKSFEAFMQKELFEPLNMKNTRVWNLFSKSKTFPNKTTGFYQKDNQYYPHITSFLDGVAGDGAVFSSLEDFLIWDKFWYNNSLVSQENLQEAFKPVALKKRKVSQYGFGWVLGDEGRISHTGSWLGARNYIIRDTKTKTCIVVLDNSTNIHYSGEIANTIEEIILKD